jgi:hypothetical protein
LAPLKFKPPDLLDPPSSLWPSLWPAYREVVRQWTFERREFTREDAVEEVARREEAKREAAWLRNPGLFG